MSDVLHNITNSEHICG